MTKFVADPKDGRLGILLAAIQDDDPAHMLAEADGWEDLAIGLNGQAALLQHRLSLVQSAWTSAGSTVYHDQISGRVEQLLTSAQTANDNAAKWRSIGTAVQQAQQAAVALYSQWTAVKATTDEAQLPKVRAEYDQEVDNIWWHVKGTAEDSSGIQPVDTQYKPLPGNSQAPDSPPTGSGPPGGVNPVNGTGPTGALPGLPGSSYEGPRLQAPSPVPTMPPITAPGGPGVYPAPGGTGPGYFPGPVPPATGLPPWGGKPVTPPAYQPNPVPRPGLPTSRPTPSLRPPSSAPSVPRPPQATVRPVIGTRPGTSGLAPTGAPRPTGNGLSRPVIGARPGGPGATAPGGTRHGVPGLHQPGAAQGAANGRTPATGSRSLISRDGVVGQPRRPGVRSRVHSGGERPNRSVVIGARKSVTTGNSTTTAATGRGKQQTDHESAPDPREEAGQYQWQPEGRTVPAVITSGAGWEGREHAAAAVVDLSLEPVTEVDEARIIDRLAQRPGNAGSAPVSDDQWRTPQATPGVIRPKPQADEFGFQ